MTQIGPMKEDLKCVSYSLSFIWTELLFQFSGVSRQFDVGVLAKLTDGYTVGSIIDVIQEVNMPFFLTNRQILRSSTELFLQVMTCKRILQLVVQPLNHFELINALSKRQPVYKEEEDMFEQWLSKTPIGRKKTRYLEMLAEKQAIMQTMKKK